MDLLIERDRLPDAGGAKLFLGAEHGGVEVSFFLLEAAPGTGPDPHLHPYPEVFVIDAGTVRFEVDGVEVRAGAGDVVIAPAGAAHRFEVTGDGVLRMTAIHPVAAMVTDWLEPTSVPAR